MMKDAYYYTDKLKESIEKEGKTIKISKIVHEIKDNAEKINFVEKLLLERNLIPSQKDMKREKCNDLSRQYRDEGNKHYKKCKFFDALQSYNRSLCFAQENSENVGLAYANRSAVYYEMKLYTLALNNITKALQHNYPQKGIDKLTKREEMCKRIIKEGKVPELSNVPAGIKHLKINHKRNPKLPFLADCLKLKSNQEFGRCIVTDVNLSPGDIVACEEPFSKCLLPENKYIYCANCLDNNFFDLFPCNTCTCAMFCSENCYKIGFEKFHQYECSIIDSLNELCTKILRISSQTFFEALYTYDSNVDQLMSAVKESKSVTIYDFDIETMNKKSQFMAIDSLVTNESLRKIADIFQRCGIVAVMTHLFLNWTKLSDLLNTECAKNFYREFIFKQTQIAAQNYHGIFDGVFNNRELSRDTQYGSGSYPFCSLINHSCAPNVVRVSYNCKNFLMVNRPIKAGEQLFDNYGYHHCLENIRVRQKALADQYMFHCSCEACKYNYPLFDDLNIATSSFVDLMDGIEKIGMLDLESAERNFPVYCKKIKNLNKYYPCRELSALQECILHCLFIFKLSPYKIKLMN